MTLSYTKTLAQDYHWGRNLAWDCLQVRNVTEYAYEPGAHLEITTGVETQPGIAFNPGTWLETAHGPGTQLETSSEVGKQPETPHGPGAQLETCRREGTWLETTQINA